MNLCICGHYDTVHASEKWYCFADKPNGDPCDCERFKVDAAAPAAEPEQLAGSRYIGQQERAWIEQEIIRVAAVTVCATGNIPDKFVFSFHTHEWGYQGQVVFELILAAWPWATHQRQLFYRAEGPFEFAGIPGQAWTVGL